MMQTIIPGEKDADGANLQSLHSSKKEGMNISSETSQRIKNMGLFCAFLVVGIHVDWHPDSGSVGWFFHHVISRGVCLIAVPYFFIVSGFFLAKHFNEVNWWSTEVKKRLRTLVVPFYTCTVLYILLSTPLTIVADHLAGRSFGTNLVWLHDWLWALGLDFTRPTMTPLWYVRWLVVLVVLSNLLKVLVTRLRYVFLAGLAILGLACECMPKGFFYDVLTEGMYPNCGPALGTFYFSLGFFIQMERIKIRMTSWMSMINLVGVMLLVVGICCVDNDQLNRVLLLATVPVFLLWVYCNMPSIKVSNRITSLAFPIYLIHCPVIVYLSLILDRLPIGKVSQSMAIYCGAALGSIGLSLMLRKFAPRFASVIFGGR